MNGRTRGQVPTLRERVHRMLTLGSTSLAVTVSLAVLTPATASAQEAAVKYCVGGLFNGYSLVTPRDEQLCVQGGGVVVG